MKIYSKYLLHTVAALLICVSFASCADNGMPIGERPLLQPGEYPLMLTASVGEMTSRSDGKEAWATGDRIGVRIGQDPDVGCYILNSDGSVMKAEKSIDWHTTQATTVKAWFPFVDLDQDLTVNISDQAQGFEEYDFLTAVEENQIYSQAVNLRFKHQMAKVSCKIMPGEGISNEEWASVKVSIGGFTKASFRNGTLAGDYIDNNKWITPVYDAEASSENMPAYEALVVPQKMNGEGFIKINLDVKSNNNIIHKALIYTLPDDTDQLQGGMHYKFNVTVNKEHLVVNSISASWSDNGGECPPGPAVFHVKLPENVALPEDMAFSDNVTSDGKYLLVKGNRFTISYEVTDDNMSKIFQIFTEAGESDRDIVNRTVTVIADDKFMYYFNYYLLSEEVSLKYVDKVQPGDYYYDNGTWGPIELRGKKTPIGVIFKAGAGSAGVYDTEENYGWTEKEINGYAVALKDAVNDMIIWGSKKSKAADVYGSYDTVKYPIPYSGYKNTMKIKEWGAKGNAYDAAKAALDYEPKAPESSSGWYLPTPQQLIDIQNIPDRARLFTDVQGDDVKNGTIDKLNEKTGKIEKITLSYWSCLEVSTQNAWIWSFDTGDPKVPKNDKSNELYVRAVLTF